MSLNGINTTTTQSAYQTKLDSTKTTADTTGSTAVSTDDDTSVIYETSSAAATTATSYTDSSSIVAQLKADAEARTATLRSIVEQLISKQSNAYSVATSGGLKSLFENLEVDAQTKAQAQEDISEDGYWGVKATSQRLVDFAKALSGGDASKIDELTEAIKKGFEQAEAAWGGTLPDICQQTYDAVMKAMDEWKAEATSQTEA